MPTIRDNKLEFKMTGISNFKFQIEEHSISSGQPWEGISSTGCNGEGCNMIVRAGRHGTEEVAKWFKNRIGEGSAIACDSFDRLPGSLNFAFKGTMKFNHRGNTYVGKEVVIAQGHNARSRNNWWIGGQNMDEMINVPTIFAVISQSFDNEQGIVPAKILFTTTIGHISSIGMGIIQIG